MMPIEFAPNVCTSAALLPTAYLATVATLSAAAAHAESHALADLALAVAAAATDRLRKDGVCPIVGGDQLPEALMTTSPAKPPMPPLIPIEMLPPLAGVLLSRRSQ